MRLQRPLMGALSSSDCLLGDSDWDSRGGLKAPLLEGAVATQLGLGGRVPGGEASGLGVPRGFGTIFCGQEFRCCVVAIHSGVGGSTAAVRNVQVSAFFQVGDDGVDRTVLHDVRAEAKGFASSLPVGSSVDLVVSHRLSMAGPSVLRVVVTWHGGDVGGKPGEFRKFYRFPVLDPWSITPVTSIPLTRDVADRLLPPSERGGLGRHPVLLRLTLANRTGAAATISPGACEFRPSVVAGKRAVVLDSGLAGETVEAGEERGVGVVLLDPDRSTDGAAANVMVGTLAVPWRGPGGEDAGWESPTVLMPGRHLADDAKTKTTVACRSIEWVDGRRLVGVGECQTVQLVVDGEVTVHPSGKWPVGGPVVLDSPVKVEHLADSATVVTMVFRAVRGGSWVFYAPLFLDVATREGGEIVELECNPLQGMVSG
jgi:hypothetical protein